MSLLYKFNICFTSRHGKKKKKKKMIKARSINMKILECILAVFRIIDHLSLSLAIFFPPSFSVFDKYIDRFAKKNVYS